MAKFQQLSDVIQYDDPLISALGEKAQSLDHSLKTRLISEEEYKHMMAGIMAHHDYADIYCNTDEEKEILSEAVMTIYNNTQYSKLS